MTWLATGVLAVKLFRAIQIAIVLGGIILVHEFGHFIVAKLSGMVVDEFAIGLGPTIYKWRRGDTLYRIAPFLFMGYVRIRGLEGEDSPHELPGSFYTRPGYQRLLVLLAGALMNVVFATFVFIALYGFWGVLPPDTTIEEVSAGKPAQRAGVEPDWKVVAVDGQQVKDSTDVTHHVKDSGGRPLRFRLTRGAEQREVVIAPEREPGSGLYRIGVKFRVEAGLTTTVGKVDPGGPSWRAGLRPGDRIVAVSGQPVQYADQALQGLVTVPKQDELKAPDQVKLPPVAVTVLRGGQELNLQVVPVPKREKRAKEPPKGQVAKPDADTKLEDFLIGDVGLALQRQYQRLSLGESISEGLQRTKHVLSMVVLQLRTLLGGQHLDEVGGPVMIVKYLSEAAFLGWYDLLDWAGMLSIMIGVFNLLPLPALDGGRVLFLLVEPLAAFCLSRFGVRDPKETSRRVETLIHALGLVVLLALMVLVSIRDIRTW